MEFPADLKKDFTTPSFPFERKDRLFALSITANSSSRKLERENRSVLFISAEKGKKKRKKEREEKSAAAR